MSTNDGEGRPNHPTRVLVVENDGDAASVIRSALEGDYTIDIVTSAAHGAELAKRRPYAVAVIDDCCVSDLRETLGTATLTIVRVRWPFTQAHIEDAVAEALLDSSAG